MTGKESPGGIVDFFSELEDPRLSRKRDHELIDIIVIAIMGVLCGAEHWTTIEEFGKSKLEWLKTFLSLKKGIPSHDTFGRVFALLDPEAFSRCFYDWIASLHELTGGEVIALDGKTVRGSFDKATGRSAIHLVSAWAVQNGIALGQRKVDDKSNEITAIPKLLALLNLEGSTVTIDAMGCQKAIAQQIVDQKGEYILALKGNQPTIFNDVVQNFEGAATEILDRKASDHFETTDGDHGRIEVRKYWVVTELGMLDTAINWPGLSAIGVVDRTRMINGSETTERQFYLLSKATSGEEFGRAVRGHWHVENGLHWHLDVTFHEDQCRVRTGNAAENFSTLRKIALALLKKQRPKSKVGIAGMRLRCGWENEYLLRMLIGGL